MKKILLTTVMFAAAYAYADAPPATPAPAPTVIGTWNMTTRACTSNAAAHDGMKAGDTIVLKNNDDNTFELTSTMGGCATDMKGAYAVDGMKVDYTSATSQSCKDADAQPLVGTVSVYFAYLSDTEAVTVQTGDSAAMVCPQGDALITHFNKDTGAPAPAPAPSPTP